VNVTAVPTVPVAGPAIVTARVNGLMTMLADAVAVAALESLALTDTVNVPLVA